MRMTSVVVTGAALLLWAAEADGRVVRLRVERREVVLNGRAFGKAGAYEKLAGTVEFALDPAAALNRNIVDLKLAPRNPRGEVEFTADFYMLQPVDAAKGNGRLLFEVGNRGGKAALARFQNAHSKSVAGSRDPSAEEDFGDGRLMNEGYTIAWMGWQWDVPEGQMRMEMPIAKGEGGKTITGLVRANFIPNDSSPAGPLADRGHRAYPVDNPDSAEHVMTVRDRAQDPPKAIARGKWRFVMNGAEAVGVSVEGGFELGRIYDVVYRARDPRVVGTGLAGTRDFVSHLKRERGLRVAYGWGVSQSGRFLRHFLYEGFNEDEGGKQVFDGVIDEVGGAGRGSFNHRFAQASRDAEQFFNVFYPVDMFPFTDGPETDPETGKTDSLLGRAEARRVAPKVMHILSNSEYFNRAGSLIHTEVGGKRDAGAAALGANSRIYTIASGPHFASSPALGSGDWKPVKPAGASAFGNPLSRDAVVVALLWRLDAWVMDGVAPPESRIPRVADGTLVATEKAGWPAIAGVPFPVPYLRTYRLDFGPRWATEGIVDFEPPKMGKEFAALVPAVDANGNSIAGIRLPLVEAPVGTYGGWNFRAASIGASRQLFGELGSFHPLPCTKAARVATGDSRLSIEERYRSREEYEAKAAAAARLLVRDGFLMALDERAAVDGALRVYDWMVQSHCRQ